jgi:hypothetical protein
VFAALLFIVILGFSAISYSNFAEKYFMNEGKAQLETSIVSITETLIKSKGYPTDWENNVPGLEVLGLAQTENILSLNKVNAFESISYNETKDLLGVSGEYYIEIRSVDDQVFFSKGSELVNTSSVSLERTVFFNQSFSRLVVRLYER